MPERKTICYIEEKHQPSDFVQCTNCHLNRHTCELNYEQFVARTKNYHFRYDKTYEVIKNICQCDKCLNTEYCEYHITKGFEKAKEIEKINCKVCRSKNGLDRPLDISCKCQNKKELYFYKISMYNEIDMNKNECYTIDVFKYEDFLKAKNNLHYAVDYKSIIISGGSLTSPICSFTIFDSLDDSDVTIKELLEKYKTMLNNDMCITDSFYFRKFKNLYDKILARKVVNVEPKPNVHLTRKKKINKSQ